MGFGRAAHTIRKCHHQLEQAALPDGLLLAGDATLPRLEIQHALRVLLWPGVEAERVVLPPLLPGAHRVKLARLLQGRLRRLPRAVIANAPFLLEAVLAQRHFGGFG